MTAKATGHVYWGMGINLFVTALVVSQGVVWHLPGVPVAAVALTAGMIAEMIYLGWRVRPVQARLQLIPTPITA